MIDWGAEGQKGGKEMDIKWPSKSVDAALRGNYQANGVNAGDEMGLGDERRERMTGKPDMETNCSGEND